MSSAERTNPPHEPTRIYPHLPSASPGWRDVIPAWWTAYLTYQRGKHRAHSDERDQELLLGLACGAGVLLILTALFVWTVLM